MLFSLCKYVAISFDKGGIVFTMYRFKKYSQQCVIIQPAQYIHYIICVTLLCTINVYIAKISCKPLLMQESHVFTHLTQYLR